MYRQQSLITLDQFYEWKPLSKLEALLSFIDYTLLDEYFKPDSHRCGPKGYSKKQLFNTLISMQIEQFSDIKSLVTRLKSDPVFRRSLGYDYFENTPSEATLNRFIKTLAESDILEKTFRRMVSKARQLGLIDGTNVAIDASKLTAYEHAVPKSKIPSDDSCFPNWGGKAGYQRQLHQMVWMENACTG
ncbi:MAG: transposase [Roseburia hominis]